MHVVLINGPAGAGKTVYADGLTKRLKEILSHKIYEKKHGVASVLRAGFKDPGRHMLYAFAASVSLIPLTYDPFDDALYEWLKDQTIAGVKGRHWMISWLEAMRKEQGDVLERLFLIKSQRINPDVVISDSMGFPAELEFFKRAARDPDSGVLGVTSLYLDGSLWNHKYEIYRDGQQFPNDSRICLINQVKYVNVNIHDLAETIADSIQMHAAQSTLPL